MDWAVTLISSLISGVVAVAVSILYYRRYERIQMKLSTLREFSANRYDLRGDAFTKALNEVFVVFNDSGNVRTALKRFHENRVSGTQDPALADQYLIELFKAMCDDVGVKSTGFTDSFFLKPFNVRQSKQG